MPEKQYRDASSGEYVSAEYAAEHPNSTVSEVRSEKIKFFFGSVGSVVIEARNSREASRIYVNHLRNTDVDVNTELGGRYQFRLSTVKES